MIGPIGERSYQPKCISHFGHDKYSGQVADFANIADNLNYIDRGLTNELTN
jgi:hypothetical protein